MAAVLVVTLAAFGPVPFRTLAAPASAVPVRAISTPDWSGFGLAGSGFTGVTGTFNVPAPIGMASCFEATAVWVGVDGLHNHDLLQAGIAETGFTLAGSTTAGSGPPDAFPGLTCSGRPQVYAWWEDLPSAPVRVGLAVNVGDRVAVSIFKMSPGWWALVVHDLTARHSFALAQPYAGPQTSVEWVVEAPQILGVLRRPVPCSPVHFIDLSAEGEVHDLERFSLTSGFFFASSRDAVGSTAQLLGSGFAVHFTVRKGREVA